MKDIMFFLRVFAAFLTGFIIFDHLFAGLAMLVILIVLVVASKKMGV